MVQASGPCRRQDGALFVLTLMRLILLGVISSLAEHEPSRSTALNLACARCCRLPGTVTRRPPANFDTSAVPVELAARH